MVKEDGFRYFLNNKIEKSAPLASVQSEIERVEMGRKPALALNLKWTKTITEPM